MLTVHVPKVSCCTPAHCHSATFNRSSSAAINSEPAPTQQASHPSNCPARGKHTNTTSALSGSSQGVLHYQQLVPFGPWVQATRHIFHSSARSQVRIQAWPRLKSATTFMWYLLFYKSVQIARIEKMPCVPFFFCDCRTERRTVDVRVSRIDTSR